MQTLQDLIGKLTNIPDALAEFMPGEVETTAKDFIALKVAQIRREGLIGKPTYSNKPGVPAYLYKGKNGDYPNTLNAAGRALIDKRIKAKTKDNKYANFINWKDLRNVQGLQTTFVDLSYSNDMLNTLAVVGKVSNRTIYIGRIGASSPKNIVKFAGAFKRYGDFFQPTDQQRQILGKASALRVGKFITTKILATSN